MFTKMPKNTEETKNVDTGRAGGRWEWNNETLTLEFISPSPPEKVVVRKRRPTDVNFTAILQKSEWLAEIYRVNNRGQQSTRKSLDPAHLKAYRLMVMQNQGDCVTIDDVKQVAVSLLLENYSLPIPQCFLALLKSKQLDEVLLALLSYLYCFFEYKSLESKPKSFIALDVLTDNQMMARSLAKRDLALKKLAVSYFSLILDRETGQKQQKSRASSDHTEWLLEGVLYSFFCYVAWVVFGRKELKDIHYEIGRLLYSDNFNTAVKKTKDEVYSRRTSTVSNGSEKKKGADPKTTEVHSVFKLRLSHRSMSSVVNQRSPLMLSLLPSPREQSPHLFLGPKARPETVPQTQLNDSKALMEELNQQLSTLSIGILGQSLKLFNPVTLIQEDQSRDTERDKASVNDGQA